MYFEKNSYNKKTMAKATYCAIWRQHAHSFFIFDRALYHYKTQAKC